MLKCELHFSLHPSLAVNEATYMLTSLLLDSPMIFFEPPPPSPPTLQPTYPRYPVTDTSPQHTRSHTAQPADKNEEVGDVTKNGNVTSSNCDVTSPGRSSAPAGSSKEFREFVSTRNSEIERCNSLKYKMKQESQEVRSKAKENCSIM